MDNSEDLTNGGPPKLGLIAEISGASGWTPVDNSIPMVPVLWHEDFDRVLRDNVYRKDWQRQELLGFTTLELINLDVITTRRLKPSNLPSRLHQLFRRDKWESMPPPHFPVKTLYPLPKPFSGSCTLFRSQASVTVFGL
jgi:hypothetical protein